MVRMARSCALCSHSAGTGIWTCNALSLLFLFLFLLLMARTVLLSCMVVEVDLGTATDEEKSS